MLVFVYVLQDLSIGAKHIRLLTGGNLVYDGDLDKGCGNQVFDYGKTINIISSSDARVDEITSVMDNVQFHSDDEECRTARKANNKSSLRSQTRIMSHSKDGPTLPVLRSQTDLKESPEKVGISQQDDVSKPPGIVTLNGNMFSCV